MPMGLSKLVFGVLFSLTLVSSVAAASPTTNRAQTPPVVAGAVNDRVLVSVPKPIIKEASPPVQRCSDTTARNGSELCASWVAANAARDGIEQARANIYWTRLTALGLFLTLTATAWAAFSAARAAKAAEGSVEVSEDVGRRQLRAYVGFLDQAVADFREGGRPAFQVKIQNHGQTPAYDVRCVILVRVSVESVDRFRFRFGDQSPAVSRSVLGPGQWVLQTTRSAAPLELEAIRQIRAGELAMMLAGILSYRDAFGRRRLSTFRYYLEAPGSTSQTLFDLSACSVGNHAN